MGEIYEEDDYIELNPKKAIDLYKKAADLGYENAMIKFGDKLIRGENIERDTKKEIREIILKKFTNMKIIDKE